MPAKPKYELKLGMATRESFGKALVELGAANPNVVVLDADLSKSTYTAEFGKKFPDRFFECGIAEAEHDRPSPPASHRREKFPSPPASRSSR